MTFDEWALYGITKGWCGPPVCSTHDGTPISDDEAALFDDGSDPCIHVMRLYESADVRDAVEMSHAPSRWRKPAVGA